MSCRSCSSADSTSRRRSSPSRSGISKQLAFIRGFGTDYESAIAGLEKLVAGRKHFTRTREGVKDQLDAIRRNPPVWIGDQKVKLMQFEVHRQVAEIVLRDLRYRGQLYHDGSVGYLFLNDERRLFAIESDDLDLRDELNHYGLASSEEATGFVMDSLAMEARAAGIRTTVYAFRHYDVHAGVLYVHNLDQQVYRISPGGKRRLSTMEPTACFF